MYLESASCEKNSFLALDSSRLQILSLWVVLIVTDVVLYIVRTLKRVDEVDMGTLGFNRKAFDPSSSILKNGNPAQSNRIVYL